MTVAMPPTSNTRRLLYVGAAAVALVAIALALLAIGFLRHDAQQREVAATQNLARSVLQTVDELVTSIDYVLRVSADGIEHRLASHELQDLTRQPGR